MGVPNWFYDFQDGDHIIALTPMIDKREEIDAFLKKFVHEKQDIYMHTIEKDKVTKTYSNLMTLYGDYFEKADASNK
jgi:hypothetical protein